MEGLACSKDENLEPEASGNGTQIWYQFEDERESCSASWDSDVADTSSGNGISRR